LPVEVFANVPKITRLGARQHGVVAGKHFLELDR